MSRAMMRFFPKGGVYETPNAAESLDALQTPAELATRFCAI